MTQLLVKLDLSKLGGNAFALMGAYQREARKQGVLAAHISAVLAECRSGDYDHLLQTLIKNTEA